MLKPEAFLRTFSTVTGLYSVWVIKYSKVIGTYIALSYGLNSHEALQNGTC